MDTVPKQVVVLHGRHVFRMDHLIAVQCVVDATFSQQCFVRPFLCYFSRLDDDYDVSIVDGGESVGDDDASPALPGLVQSLLNYLLTLCVQGRGGFVQEEDLGVPHQSTGYGNSLLLTSRQLGSLTTYISAVALQKEDKQEKPL